MYSIKNEEVMTTQNGGSSHRCPMCALSPKDGRSLFADLSFMTGHESSDIIATFALSASVRTGTASLASCGLFLHFSEEG
jgi:hypothetical protein